MVRKSFIQTVTFLLILMWVYAAVSKLSDFGHFRIQMHNQALPPSVQALLIYTLPPIELVVAALLLFNKTFLSGIYCSVILMSLFTGYIALSLLHYFSYIPCSCGGILEHMTWQAHLIFNLFFLLLTLTALYITIKERSMVTSKM